MSIFRHAFISARCVDVFRRYSKISLWRETGGALIGFVSKDNAIVVVDASGPGPRADLRRYSVTIDGAYTSMFCDKAYRRSNGLFDYIGDWHRHTGFCLEPSGRDIETMRIMAQPEHSTTRHPVSLIFRRWPLAFKVFVLNTSGTLQEVQHSIFEANAASNEHWAPGS